MYFNWPLSRFLYSSDSNLSQLEGRGGGSSSWVNLPVSLPSHHPLNRWQEQQVREFNFPFIDGVTNVLDK